MGDYLVVGLVGLVQGLTEFLPISSSGHLSILNLIYGTEVAGGFGYTFVLHVATMIAALYFFREDIAKLLVCYLPKNAHMKRERKLFAMIALTTAVTLPIAFVLKPRLEAMSESLLWLAGGFFLTTVALCIAEYFSGAREKGKLADMKGTQAAFVGLMQGLAVVPGFSRSGATIAAGMLAGLKRKQATRFSFLIALPIICAGVLSEGIDLLRGELTLPPLGISIFGFVIALVSGYLAISFMIHALQKIKLYWFGMYTALLGIALVAVWMLSR